MAKLKITNRYGIIPNDLLNNPRVSRKAKGLFGYLQSKPEDRDFSVERIKNDATDGKDATRAGLWELEKEGFLTRNKVKNGKGHREIEYTLYDKPKNKKPKAENPMAENPSTDNPSTENPSTNKERSSKKETVIKNTSKEVQQSGDLHEEENKPLKKESTQLSVKKEEPPQLPATPPMKGRPDIQELIYEIKKKCDQIGLAYESDKDTYFAKHILDAKEFGSFAEKIGKTRMQMAISIVSASVQINYRKGATAGPRRIYKEYQEIYNLRITKYKKESEKKFLHSIGKLC